METVKAAPTAGVRHEISKGEIKLRRIYKNNFQKPGTLTAELEQSVITKSFYPSQKTSSDMQDNLFSNAEFGFKEQVFDSTETRIAWILVPEGTTEDNLSIKLVAANKAGATLYKVLSNAPILDENQKYAISQGLKTMDDFANTQVVRYPENYPEKPNQLVLDKAGNVQYRKIYLRTTPIADQDLRGKSEIYISEAILVEMQGADILAGQTL